MQLTGKVTVSTCAETIDVANAMTPSAYEDLMMTPIQRAPRSH